MQDRIVNGEALTAYEMFTWTAPDGVTSYGFARQCNADWRGTWTVSRIGWQSSAHGNVMTMEAIPGAHYYELPDALQAARADYARR